MRGYLHSFRSFEKNEKEKNAGPDEMAKISVFRAKMSKFRFVAVDLVMKDIKGRPFL